MIELIKTLSGIVRRWRSRGGASARAADGVTNPTRRDGLANLARLSLGGALVSLQNDAVLAQSGATPNSDATPNRGTRLDIRAMGARGDRRTDDFDAIERAISRAGQGDQYPASIFIPAGHYRRRDSIALPNHSCLFGEGVSSILNSQHDTAFAKPILVNADSYGMISTRLQDLALYGGSHGLKLTAREENADIRLTNVTMLLQRYANIEANKLFQTVKITNCVFGDALYGIKVDGVGTNCLIATGSEWIRHAWASLYLRGADGVTIIGGRFEDGGEVGRYCLDIERASNILFLGCFFENVHEYLGRFRDISGAVVFQSCHFTGTHLKGPTLLPFRWDSADAMLVFRDCMSVVPMSVPGHVMLEGSNPGIVATGAFYEGAPQKGCLSVKPRAQTGRDAIEVVQITGAAPWRLQGRLELDTGGSQLSVLNMVISPNADPVASNAEFKAHLVRRAADQWSLAVASTQDGMSTLGWNFAWASTGDVPPVIRAPLA
ncbi:MAG: hypothetical protein EOO77_05750 [Oxalobacteraceae bacterium]|nr:MAG: hypothetical protein EOO77_05750 [Oxalobacteraceae bacterium]